MQTPEKDPSSLDTSKLSASLFALTAVIYFANAYYSYLKDIEGQVEMNIALGIMFLGIGATFLMKK